MTDKKLTDNEIIKALECCTQGRDIKVCWDCPLYVDLETARECCEKLNTNALDLITRQQAKIKEFMKETAVTTLLDDAVVYTPTLEDYNKFKKEFKSEAYKEFADKVVHDINAYCENIRTKPSVDGVTGMKIANDLIYKRLNEMEGKNNGNS